MKRFPFGVYAVLSFLQALMLLPAIALGAGHSYADELAEQKKDQPAKKSPATKAINEELRQEMRRRFKEDQDARQAWIDMQNALAASKTKENEKKYQEIFKKVQDIDHKNTKWMHEIVDAHGWPGKSLIGQDGANMAWLLVQHADNDRPFQKRCLELMSAAFKKGEVSGQELAYLTDRVRAGEGKKQLYGTQFLLVNGELKPQPIEDEANVDKRRKEVGLGTLAEYKTQLKALYQAPPKDKK